MYFIMSWGKELAIAWNIMRQIIVDDYASLFNCTTAVRASDSMTAFS